MLHNHHSHEHDDESNHNKIPTSRLEAFSDGVLAIIITITVLELKVPSGQNLSDLRPLLPLFITYLISFQMVGIYWNNHHHLLQATEHVSTSMMWSNLHLLFWLSLVPFATGWVGEHHGATIPTAVYSAILLMCAIAYSFLQKAVVAHARNRAQLMEELNKSKKGFFSLLAYICAVIFAFIHPIISDVLIILVALLWFVPDKRIEKYL